MNPRPRPDGLLIELVAPVAEHTNRTGRVLTPAVPAHVRVVGPLGGTGRWDAARCRLEAARLVDAAKALDAANHAATAEAQPTLFDEALT